MLKLNDNEYLFDENDINLIDILENGNRIEVIEVIGNNITNLGKLSNKEIYNFIKKEYKLKEFGIIISDSHTTPLRTGIMGIGLAYYGFNPLRDYRGKKDIFGRKLKMSQTNIVDSLSAAAVYEMGEGDEQTPVSIIEDVGEIEFIDKDFSKTDPLKISIDEDIYSPLLKAVKWKKGGIA